MDSLKKTILTQTDMCVKCGLCLPACPTYHDKQIEGESPRGRIQLIQGLLEKKINISEKSQLYLEHCLECSACESVCPAHVPYQDLIVKTKTYLYESRKPISKTPFLLRLFIKYRYLNFLLFIFLVSIDYFRIRKLFAKLKLIKLFGLENYNRYLPEKIKFFPLHKKNKQTLNKKKVMLLKGCVQQITDPYLIYSAKIFLEKTGHHVSIPRIQACCGTLSLHEGNEAEAKKLYLSLLHDQIHSSSTYFISLATGCSSGIKQIQKILSSENSAFIDILELLDQIPLERIKFKTYPKKIYIHEPCSQKNALKLKNISYKLLSVIPEAILIKSSATFCCGAGGIHMFNHSKDAEHFLNPIFIDIKNSQPDCIVTSNIGCQIHMQNYFKRHHIPIQVMHPIVLLNDLS